PAGRGTRGAAPGSEMPSRRSGASSRARGPLPVSPAGIGPATGSSRAGQADPEQSEGSNRSCRGSSPRRRAEAFVPSGSLSTPKASDLEDLRRQLEGGEAVERQGVAQVVSTPVEEGEDLAVVEGGVPPLRVEQVRERDAAAWRLDGAAGE